MILERFYPIVDSAAWVERLVSCDARFIQLRIKNSSAHVIREETRLALRHCERAAAQLVVNDHWQLAIEMNAAWVHLGQDDLRAADLRAIRAAGLRLGISTHDHAELDTALAARPDYVALGPVYPTTLKVMPWAPQGLARVREWKERIGRTPLVAIGGLTPERARAVLTAGADCAAVVNDIVSHREPEQRVGEWLAATRP